jgi:hypothetical protein
MNKRIQELAEQSNASFGDRLEYAVVFGEMEDFEKFIELIVQDSCDVLLKWKNEPFPFDEKLAASLIREHFGVK